MEKKKRSWNSLNLSQRIFNIMRKGLVRSIFRHNSPELTISYVWASKVPTDKPYVSPSDKRMIVIPIETGSGIRGVWIDEKRNIYEDLREISQNKRIVLKKIRIRSDTDNTGSNAESGLRKIVISGKEAEEQ